MASQKKISAEKFQARFPTIYQVAMKAWGEGLTTNSILDDFDLPRTPQNLTRVRRSLEKAVRDGILEIRLPRNTQLEVALSAAYKHLVEVHVELDREATCLRAAKIIFAEIEAFLAGPKTTMCIANAGGHTLRDTINALERLVPVPPRRKDKTITFLSLNAAETYDRFDQGSNFLSVRLAQLFGCEHFAVVKHWDGATADLYREAIEDIDLLITSAGGRDGLLAYWLKTRGLEFPEDAPGDFAFHLLGKKGKPLDLPKDVCTLIERELLRAPAWDDLVRLLLQNKVLLILTGDKAEIGRAILSNGLAKRCVIDSQLAKILSLRKDGGDRPAGS